jgi:hypothetical protein
MKKSELVNVIREEVANVLREKNMKRKNIKEGALDDQIAAAEKKVDDAKKTLAAAETALAQVKEKEANASSAA